MVRAKKPPLPPVGYTVNDGQHSAKKSRLNWSVTLH